VDVLRFSKLTDEFVRVPVRGIDSGNDIVPTSYVVSLAFVRGSADPVSGDWGLGEWETDSTVSPPRYWALRKATTLPAGNYAIWVRIVTGNETVIRSVGPLRVT